MSAALPRRVRIEDGVVFRDLAGEAVLLNLTTGLYYGLDEVGTRIWSLLAEGRDVEDVLEVLLSEYDVEEPRLRADVDALLGELLSRKLARADAA